MAYTIKDIAKDTGLSTATISKYINGKKISSENAKIINESIQKFGYKPNRNAQNLRSAQTGTICILMPNTIDTFWGTLCTALEESLQQHNYTTLIRIYNPAQTSGHRELQFLISRQVDGVFYLPSNTSGIDLALQMKKANIPFVYLDQYFRDAPSDCITSSNEQASHEAMMHLLHSGHRRIGLISGDDRMYTIQERLHGCKRAFAEFNLPDHDLLSLSGSFSVASGAETFRKMMSAPQPPSAVFFLGGNIALGAIMELNSLSIRVPEELSLISFDDNEIFSAFTPSITAIAQDFSEIAHQGVAMLTRRISGDYDGYPELKKIPTHFISRDSVCTVQIQRQR